MANSWKYVLLVSFLVRTSKHCCQQRKIWKFCSVWHLHDLLYCDHTSVRQLRQVAGSCDLHSWLESYCLLRCLCKAMRYTWPLCCLPVYDAFPSHFLPLHTPTTIPSTTMPYIPFVLAAHGHVCLSLKLSQRGFRPWRIAQSIETKLSSYDILVSKNFSTS